MRAIGTTMCATIGVVSLGQHLLDRLGQGRLLGRRTTTRHRFSIPMCFVIYLKNRPPTSVHFELSTHFFLVSQEAVLFCVTLLIV